MNTHKIYLTVPLLALSLLGLVTIAYACEAKGQGCNIFRFACCSGACRVDPANPTGTVGVSLTLGSLYKSMTNFLRTIFIPVVPLGCSWVDES